MPGALCGGRWGWCGRSTHQVLSGGPALQSQESSWLHVSHVAPGMSRFNYCAVFTLCQMYPGDSLPAHAVLQGSRKKHGSG